jgi:DNA-binding CsgD family transcriptional regulator
MDEAGQLSSLIGDIYEAAADPSCWKRALEKTASFIDASAVSIVTQGRIEEPLHYEHYFGVDLHYQRLYEEKYSKRDPRNALNLFFKAGEVFSTFSVLPDRDMRDTQFYQEYIQPQGITDNLRCVFERNPISYLGIFRRTDNDHPAENTIQRMRLLMPHVKRAVLIGTAVFGYKTKTATFIEVLDDLRAGVFLLDAKRRIVHANESGHTLLAQRILLRAQDGCLTTTEPKARQALDRGVVEAAAADATAAAGQSLSIAFQTREGDCYIAHLLPLGSGERRLSGATREAVAALFVQRVEHQITVPSELIAVRYGLTPMEVSVLSAIVEAGGVPEVADELGIARSTVKTHLLRIFAKTGTRRQAELVKLVAGLSHPLVR